MAAGLQGARAWALCRAGGLHVGPQSAGALPGPACYARGGTQPTVTDANVVLGYIRTGKLAGGVRGMAGRVGKVVRWRREVEREGLLGRRQFFGSQESLQE